VLLPVVAYDAASLPPKLFEFCACEEDIAFDVVPLTVALRVPLIVKSPVKNPEPETTNEPVITGSKIFIYNIVLYYDKYFDVNNWI
jgi:hypothetical protein